MRLDNYLVDKGFFDSRTKAKQALERGEIYIDRKKVCKASLDLNINTEYLIERKCSSSYVSLGGYKLEKALCDFGLVVNDLICADIGASTGGFTDCLIKNGAKKVYSVDLNDTLLHNSLRNNEKVVPLIKNVKDLKQMDFADNLDLIVADLSFISLTQVLPVLANLLDNEKRLIVLIKPQFEVGAKKKFKNGIVRDKNIQINACINAYDYALSYQLSPEKFTIAPVNEEKNIEFLMSFIKNGLVNLDKEKIKI